MSLFSKILLVFAFAFSLTACTFFKSENTETVENKSNKLLYAQGFSINENGDFKEIIVFNPWKTNAVYAKYYLVKNDSVETPSDGIKIKIPIQTIATTSVTHLEFLKLIGEIETISGICNPELVYNQQVQERFEKGEITNLGDAFSVNIERTLKLQPAVLMMSGYNQTDVNAQRIKQANIPVVYNNEWMETSLLGRAEWIKFVAAFYDKSEEADSIFLAINKRYNAIKEKVINIDNKPTIMAGSDFRGTWYVPAGKSYMGLLFEDAGGDYIFKYDNETGSLPLTFETALNSFSDAAIWLNCNFNSIEDLIETDKKNGLFRAVKENKVYNFNKRLLPSTANDFWESAIAQPDLLLGDVVSVLHPHILPDWKFVYINQLSHVKK